MFVTPVLRVVWGLKSGCEQIMDIPTSGFLLATEGTIQNSMRRGRLYGRTGVLNDGGLRVEQVLVIESKTDLHAKC